MADDLIGFGVFDSDAVDLPVVESVTVAAFSDNVTFAAGVPEDAPMEGVPTT